MKYVLRCFIQNASSLELDVIFNIIYDVSIFNFNDQTYFIVEFQMQVSLLKTVVELMPYSRDIQKKFGLFDNFSLQIRNILSFYLSLLNKASAVFQTTSLLVLMFDVTCTLTRLLVSNCTTSPIQSGQSVDSICSRYKSVP